MTSHPSSEEPASSAGVESVVPAAATGSVASATTSFASTASSVACTTACTASAAASAAAISATAAAHAASAADEPCRTDASPRMSTTSKANSVEAEAPAARASAASVGPAAAGSAAGDGAAEACPVSLIRSMSSLAKSWQLCECIENGLSMCLKQCRRIVLSGTAASGSNSSLRRGDGLTGPSEPTWLKTWQARDPSCISMVEVCPAPLLTFSSEKKRTQPEPTSRPSCLASITTNSCSSRLPVFSIGVAQCATLVMT
mmetsp:Transcript_18089/g.36829  ORF Transcript_18089/g.36829 Transcript_18089/m.36829 type:complete len:258 (-) Transcript_18089:216-989(-)